MDRHVIDPSWLGALRRRSVRSCCSTVVARSAAPRQGSSTGGRLAMLDRDDDAAAPYVDRILEREVQASWQLIEPTGVRLMHGPAGIRLLECLPATRWLAHGLRTLRLTAWVTAVNRLLGRIRKPLARYFPDQRRPRRWP